MPIKLQTVQHFSFAGGLNLASDAFHVGVTETADCQNVDFDVRGAVAKRKGYSTFGSTLAGLDLLVPFKPTSGNTRLMAVRQGAERNLSYYDTAGAITDLGSTGVQTAGTRNAAVVIKGAIYIVNNVDATLKYNGTTVSRLGTTADTTGHQPKAKFVTVHKNRIFFGNTDAGANPSRIRWTGSDADPGNVEHFKSTSFIDFDPDDGDEIQQIIPYLDSLVVFKRNKLYMLRGNDPRSFVKVLAQPNLGCIASRTVAAWEKGVVFLSPRGVFSFDGSRANRLSAKIDPALLALPTALLDKAMGVIHGYKYYLFVNEIGANAFHDTVYVFDLVAGVWTKYRGVNIAQAAVWARIAPDELYGIRSEQLDQAAKLLDGNSDAGAVIEAYFTSKWLDFGVPERKKANRRLYAWFIASGNYNIDVDLQRNYSQNNVAPKSVNLSPGGSLWGTATWGVSKWGAGVDVVRARLTGLGTATAVRLRVHDLSTNPWILEGVSFITQPRNFT